MGSKSGRDGVVGGGGPGQAGCWALRELWWRGGLSLQELLAQVVAFPAQLVDRALSGCELGVRKVQSSFLSVAARDVGEAELSCRLVAFGGSSPVGLSSPTALGLLLLRTLF